MDLPLMLSCEGKNQPYSVQSSHRLENLLKINSLSLHVSLHHESCFMLDDISFTILQLKHPLQTDGFMSEWLVVSAHVLFFSMASSSFCMASFYIVNSSAASNTKSSKSNSSSSVSAWILAREQNFFGPSSFVDPLVPHLSSLVIESIMPFIVTGDDIIPLLFLWACTPTSNDCNCQQVRENNYYQQSMMEWSSHTNLHE